MIIKDKLLIVVSGIYFYNEEKSGRKPYTLRITTKGEHNQLFYSQPEYIRIHKGAMSSKEYFTRKIIAMHDLEIILGKHLIGITFDPTEEV